MNLRADLCQGLQDAVGLGQEYAVELGGLVVLPPTYIGSPGSMQAWYQKSMSIVRSKGPLDPFTTFTTNSNWPEIRDSLLPNQYSADRPDFVSRVFHMKLKEYLHDIRYNDRLGKVTGMCMSIEFQKRDLPHAHIL